MGFDFAVEFRDRSRFDQGNSFLEGVELVNVVFFRASRYFLPCFPPEADPPLAEALRGSF